MLCLGHYIPNPCPSILRMSWGKARVESALGSTKTSYVLNHENCRQVRVNARRPYRDDNDDKMRIRTVVVILNELRPHLQRSLHHVQTFFVALLLGLQCAPAGVVK